MEHIMKLNLSPFQKIQSGKKTIELRLYDEKRRKIQIGDNIRFINTDNPSETLVAEVVNLFVFDSFEELYRKLPLLECGYTDQNIKTASPKHMDIYYSKKLQEQYGVVGIQIRLI